MKGCEGGNAPLCLTSASVGSYPGETKTAFAKIMMKIPQGFCGLVTGSSSVALKGVQAHAGIIDNDYRGNVAIILTNIGCYPQFEVMPGDRIGQICLSSFSKAKWIEVSKFEDKEPNDRHGGFSSTGR